MKIVISQPMFFPWVGLFEQIRLADSYIHYDDVQFSKGSFVNRVQIKTSEGFKWLTVPLANLKLGQKIREVHINYQQDWQTQHVQFLSQTYAKSPFKNEMLDVVNYVYSCSYDTISDLAIASINAVCKYFGIAHFERFLYSSKLGIPGKSSQRVLDIIKLLDGHTYITGHGARNYLDHELFEQNGIIVEYMVYQKTPYPQLHGEFNPHVSILDLIANVGHEGIQLIHSDSKYWKEFLNESNR
jgi:hypothetical protein